MLGPYIKSRGSRATEMSANADLITVETYVYFGLFGGPPPPPPEWVFDEQTGPILLSSYPLTHNYVQSDKKFLSLNPKYEFFFTFFHIWGSWGGGGLLRRTQVNENFRAVRPHNRAEICTTREQNNHQFFI